MNLTFYENVLFPVVPENQVELEWEELIELLTTFIEADEKEKVPMFNLWQLKTLPEAEEGHWGDQIVTGTIRRCKNNCIGVWGLVLDYDANKSIKEVEEMLNGFEYVIYTTFNNSVEKNKFRVVMPFDRMMTKDEFDLKIESISATFEGADSASFTMSQAIYLHSGKNPTLAYARRWEGIILTVDSFEDQVKPEIVPQAQKEQLSSSLQEDVYREAVLTSLESCRGVHRGARTGDGGALTLGLICKSVNASFPEFQRVCMLATDGDSCMQDESTQHKVWAMPGDRITKAVRDDFIFKYGGQPIKMKYPESEEIKIIRNINEAFDKIRNKSRSHR
jgi:hypothetical protein